jgi:hypothetical protein
LRSLGLIPAQGAVLGDDVGLAPVQSVEKPTGRLNVAMPASVLTAGAGAVVLSVPVVDVGVGDSVGLGLGLSVGLGDGLELPVGEVLGDGLGEHVAAGVGCDELLDGWCTGKGPPGDAGLVAAGSLLIGLEDCACEPPVAWLRLLMGLTLAWLMMVWRICASA